METTVRWGMVETGFLNGGDGAFSMKSEPVEMEALSGVLLTWVFVGVMNTFPGIVDAPWCCSVFICSSAQLDSWRMESRIQSLSSCADKIHGLSLRGFSLSLKLTVRAQRRYVSSEKTIWRRSFNPHLGTVAQLQCAFGEMRNSPSLKKGFAFHDKTRTFSVISNTRPSLICTQSCGLCLKATLTGISVVKYLQKNLKGKKKSECCNQPLFSFSRGALSFTAWVCAL